MIILSGKIVGINVEEKELVILMDEKFNQIQIGENVEVIIGSDDVIV